jgi:hypothetical protein
MGDVKEKHLRLCKKGKFRVQVIVWFRKFSFNPSIVMSRVRLGVVIEPWV